MPHVDFVSAEQTIRTGRDRSPLELGLAWLVDFEKGHFNGRRALLAERAGALGGYWSGWTSPATSRRTTRSCTPAADGKREIGSVSSATWSPTCKRNIALAMVDAPYFEAGLDQSGPRST